MNDAALNAIDADATALASAGALTADALALHRDALALLTEGWDSESGSTAADLIRRQCGDAAELVAALHGAAAEFRSLRDIFEEAGSVPHTEPDTAAAHPDQNYALTAARLNDRPQPSFEAPAVPPTSPPTPTAWPSGAMSVPVPVPMPAPVPGFGGALVSLIAQAADALSADAVDTSQVVDPVVTADPAKEVTASPHRSTVAPTPLPPALPRDEATPAPANDPVPQPDPPPQPQLEPQLQPELQPELQPQAEPEPPLLTAERPAQPETPPAEVTDARTPCEIAVDELPQVGQ
jgi:hypothetical protein